MDILGIGLHGIIPVREWSVAFTADMRMLAQPGDIVDILVTEITRGKSCISVPGGRRFTGIPGKALNRRRRSIRP